MNIRGSLLDNIMANDSYEKISQVSSISTIMRMKNIEKTQLEQPQIYKIWNNIEKKLEQVISDNRLEEYNRRN